MKIMSNFAILFTIIEIIVIISNVEIDREGASHIVL